LRGGDKYVNNIWELFSIFVYYTLVYWCDWKTMCCEVSSV